ncbi:GNAT family N-acetyltransferase [Zhihengliuella halotolerans]|uniref:Ribosomal protein S18 acetylase RimI-like enzyme n=1 Tax=Zhihengliuella halotolerans TaxID=370736 RepID=A0A4Q8AAX8_9MICC|nr:GNAT family N-acetyltransferase [Zhihengliuella halotolerans]RZU61228.1 ribosomal protein S18 acetylase RimI-like enzyme [Zhihengliuella halotolerans]
MSQNTCRIRPAEPRDVPVLLALITELAEYEREPDAVRNTGALLHEHLFGPDPKVFAHVAEETPTDDDGASAGDPAVVGMAIWFLNYSTWEGVHGIHLEDLYVRPSARKNGHGKALLATLAQLAVERDYARLEWAVLDWNELAIGFYDAIGADSMSGWTTRRLHGEALTAVAAHAPKALAEEPSE